MSKKNSRVKEPTPGSTIAFRTVFIILFILLIALGVLTFAPPAYQATLGQANFRGGMENFIGNLGKKLDGWYGFKETAFQSVDLYKNGWILFLGILSVLIINIYFILKCFSLMSSVKRAHKSKIGLRRFFLSLLAIVDILVLAVVCLIPFDRFMGTFGAKLYGYYGLCLGKFGAVLEPIKFFTLNGKIQDTNFTGCFWIFLIFILFNILMMLLITLPNKKTKEDVEKTEEEKAVANEEEKTPAGDAAEPAPIPEEEKKAEPTPVEEEKTEEENLIDAVNETNQIRPNKKKPVTRRELAILNTLEPFNLNKVETLPGIYVDDTNQIIEGLEPRDLKNAALPDEQEEETKPIDVLPGVDEWNADPWGEEIKPVEEKKLVPIPPVREEAVEDMTEVASAEEVQQEIFEEKEPEPEETKVEEPKPEPETTPVETIVEDVEEKVPEEPVEEGPDYRELETKPVDIDNTWVLPTYDPEEEKRRLAEEELERSKKALEEEKKKVEEEKKRLEEEARLRSLEEEKRKAEEEEKKLREKEEREKAEQERLKALEPDHRNLETKPVEIDDNWVLPEYDPNKDIKPVEEEKPAEVQEEKAQPKPTVKVIKMNPIHKPLSQQNKPKVAPIAPIKHEEAPEEPVEEEKKLEKISKPIHEVSKREMPKDIKPVAARKVKFELSKYRIRTYQGELTSEEAFLKGVTKVQPTAQPIFTGQKNDSALKRRRREEEIKKNGYENINIIKNTQDLKPVKPISQDANTANITSIRDLVKASKAEEAKPTEAVNDEPTEEKKNIKPISPIKPVETNEPKPQKEEVRSDVVKPVAPLAVKKPTNLANRPKPTAIKPISPIKLVKPTKPSDIKK